MKIKNLILILIMCCSLNLTFSQSRGESRADMEKIRKDQAKSRAAKKAARQFNAREAARKRAEQARIRRENLIIRRKNAQFERINKKLSGTGFLVSFEGCQNIQRVSTQTYSDDSWSITITRTDGSTQNSFIEPNGREYHGTAGTDSHKNFIKEAIASKRAEGVEPID